MMAGGVGVVAVGAGDAHAQVGAGIAAQHLVLFEQDHVAAAAPGLDRGAVARDAGADDQDVAGVGFMDFGEGGLGPCHSDALSMGA